MAGGEGTGNSPGSRRRRPGKSRSRGVRRAGAEGDPARPTRSHHEKGQHSDCARRAVRARAARRRRGDTAAEQPEPAPNVSSASSDASCPSPERLCTAENDESRTANDVEVCDVDDASARPTRVEPAGGRCTTSQRTRCRERLLLDSSTAAISPLDVGAIRVVRATEAGHLRRQVVLRDAEQLRVRSGRPWCRLPRRSAGSHARPTYPAGAGCSQRSMRRCRL